MALAAPVESKIVMGSNQEQLAILIGKNNLDGCKGLGYNTTTYPIMVKAYKLKSCAALIEPTLDELAELEAEQKNLSEQSRHSGEEILPSKAWWSEFADVVVMLKVIQEIFALKRKTTIFSAEEIVFSVDGQFKGSFKSLHEQISGIQEGDLNHNLKLIYSELLSLLKHVNVNLQGLALRRLTNTKLALNRETRFFQLEDGMTDTEIFEKNKHVFACLRLLRNEFFKQHGLELTLQPWITNFFYEEILDWHHSDQALIRLKAKIELFKEELKNQIFRQLTDNTVGKSDSMTLLMIMSMLGLPTIKDPCRPPKPLQNIPYSATLHKDTLFWV